MITLVGDWAPLRRQVHIDLAAGTSLIVNLEGPVLTDTHNLRAPPKAGPQIWSTALPDLAFQSRFVLANNHTMDFGPEGLDATRKALEQRGAQFAGAGKTVSAARAPMRFQTGEQQVAVLACCEAQFGIATDMRPGVAQVGPWLYRSIGELSGQQHAVIVSVHLGVEDSPWPAPGTQELYRSFIDAGAAVVHGHHAHIPQAFEQYRGGLICYGLGNFAVDPSIWRDLPNALWSTAFQVAFANGRQESTHAILEVQDSAANVVKVAPAVQPVRRAAQEYLAEINEHLQDQSLLTELWQEIAVRIYYQRNARYLRFLASHADGPLRGVSQHALQFGKICYRKLRMALSKPFQASRDDLLLWHHLFVCQSHYDSIATALGVLSGEISDRRSQRSSSLVDKYMPWTIGAAPS